MHKNVKLGVAALSLGAAAATIGAVPAGADGHEGCTGVCEPIKPGADPYDKWSPAMHDTWLKFQSLDKFEGTGAFHKVDAAFGKIDTLFGDIFNKYVAPDDGRFEKIDPRD